MNDEETRREPWERQNWESGTAFRAFREFYLSQDPPRSIDEAFRRYRRQRRGITEAPNKRCPGTWRRWSLGIDRDGVKLDENVRTWIERADAWDQHRVDVSNAAIEARWQAEIMGKTEVLGRLSEQGRVNPGIFFTKKQGIIYNKKGAPLLDEDGNPLTQEYEDIDWDVVREKGHLIKSLARTQYGWKIEMYDGQAALVHMGRHMQLFTDAIDLTSNGQPLAGAENMSDEQLKDALTRLSQVGLALAGGENVCSAENQPAGEHPEG